ncbi:MAG: four helix bundle protein [Ignavibacteriae bacterium]|nr:four helix bundle protein [Ignavibacteriota bacterium]
MEEKSKCFENVKLWQKAHKFVLDIYKITKQFPREELYGLTSQIRRASVSITANFVEGFKKKSISDKARYYNIAQGSLNETKYYLRLVKDLEYYDTTELNNELEEIAKMLEAYTNALFRNNNKI